MSLATPEKIRDFQKKLYVKAKGEPNFRFYSLYDKIHRADILAHAYALAKGNQGAPGVDGETFEKIEAEGLEDWLARLGEELREGRYEPRPVRRVYIPKPGGGQRPLGIPVVRDRVAQTAAKLVLEPIFEADFEEGMYGYRPERSAQGAVEEVVGALRNGQTDVVDADLSKYFDTIPHEDLLKAVARRVCDGKVLHLIKLWLKAPVEERTESGKTRMTGGKGNKIGTPQGGVMSPLLANIYMNRYMRAWRERGEDRNLKAVVVNYADDFVILSRGKAAQALELTRRWMKSLKLTMNDKKTRLCDARKETLDFLGYTFGLLVFRPTGKRYLGAKPSDKALTRLREKLRSILSPWNTGAWEETAARVNRMTRGWANYFSIGSIARAYWKMNRFLEYRVRRFLVRRHKVPGRGTRRFPTEWIFGPVGIRKLQSRRVPAAAHAWA
jgi:RNA-directed DNA polymerase